MSRRKTGVRGYGVRLLDGRVYRVTYLEPGAEAAAVADRTNPRQNSFDQSYMKGRFPAWIRRQGHEVHDGERDDPLLLRRRYGEPRPLGYNRPGAEEPYVQALAEFFDTRIALMPPKDRQVLQDVKDRLHAVMHDRRAFEDQAADLGVTKQAVQQAQARAVDQLVESCGGKAALAEKLRQYLHDKEAQDGLDRVKFLPRWVHG